MSQRLIILGTGGNAYDVLDVVEAVNAIAPAWEVAGFLDDGRAPGNDYLGLPVLGGLRDAPRFGDCWFISAMRNEKIFRRKPEILARTGLGPERFATLVHPAAGVSSRARLGRGVYVNYGASVAGGVEVGDHVSVGPGCIVGHNAVLGDCSILAPGAVVSGFVHVGRCCYLGAASVVRQQLRVADRALVGMGAVVVHDVAPEAVVVGNPARPLERAKVA